MTVLRPLFCLACLLLLSIPVVKAVGSSGIAFIENKGQWDASVLYMARFAGGVIYIQQDGVVYEFYQEGETGDRHGAPGHQHTAQRLVKESNQVKVAFGGKPQTPRVEAVNITTTQYNFYRGDDPSRWASNARAAQKIVLHEVYPGVDFQFYSQAGNFKYDFIVQPGADPNQISLEYKGVESVERLGTTALIKTKYRELIEQEPVAWQETAEGKQSPVNCRYKLHNNELRFALPGGYDREQTLIIDPVLIFSTYSGSFEDNWGFTATYDDEGNFYSGGMVNGAGLSSPTGGPFVGESYAGGQDVAILKYDSTGRELRYATILGGSYSDVPSSMIVTPQGKLLILGVTGSPDYPSTPGAFDRTFNGGESRNDNISGFTYPLGADMFIARLSPEGILESATFLGGNREDGVKFSNNVLTKNYGDQFRGEINTDAAGNAYIASVTNSFNIPLAAPVQTVYQGGDSDGAFFKLNADLSDLLIGTYLGGSGDDALYTVKLNTRGEILVAGGTGSSNLPMPDTTALLTDWSGQEDGFIYKIAPEGGSLVTGTYVGTSLHDQIFIIDVDSSDYVYTFGQTTADWAVVGDVYSESLGKQFITKISPDLDSLAWSTKFGTSRANPDISPTAFMVNACNNIYLSGWGAAVGGGGVSFGRNTNGLTVTPDAYQPTTDGADFYFLVLSQDARELLYATYFGDPTAFDHVDGGTSRFSKDGIIYQSVCASCGQQGSNNDNFPTFPDDVWSPVNAANNCNNAAIKFDLATLTARIQTNRPDGSEPGYATGCDPLEILFENLSTGGESFTWDFGDGTISTQPDQVLHTYDRPGTYRVQLKAENRSTCRAVDYDFTTIEVLPSEYSVSPSDSICIGQEIRLSATGGTSYIWTPARGLSDFTSPTPTASPAETTSYTVFIDNNGICEFVDTVTVAVIDAFADFELVTKYSCFERPSFELTNLSSNLAVFSWDFGNGETSTAESPVYQYPQDSGRFTITLSGRTAFCTSEKSVEVVTGNNFYPNVITPNDDELNQYFSIKAPVPIRMEIYDRWGKQVYSMDGYDNSWEATGRSETVFYYEATYPDDSSCRGWLHVLR